MDNMMKLLFFMIIAMITCIIFACGRELYNRYNRLESGIVYAKEYEPERTYVIFIPMKIGKVVIQHPYFVRDREDYIIKIRKGNKKSVYYVDKTMFERTKIGDIFTNNGRYATTDRNNTKTRKRA